MSRKGPPPFFISGGGIVPLFLSNNCFRFQSASPSIAFRLIPQCPVAGQPFLEHALQHRDFEVDVVVDSHLTLVVVEAVKAAGILGEGPFP